MAPAARLQCFVLTQTSCTATTTDRIVDNSTLYLASLHDASSATGYSTLGHTTRGALTTATTVSDASAIPRRLQHERRRSAGRLKARSADKELAVLDELVLGHLEVVRCWAAADAAAAVVVRAVARAEPAVEIASIGHWDAAEVRADAKTHDPLQKATHAHDSEAALGFVACGSRSLGWKLAQCEEGGKGCWGTPCDEMRTTEGHYRRGEGWPHVATGGKTGVVGHLRVDVAGLIGLRVSQVGERHRHLALDLCVGAVLDKDGLAAPLDCDGVALLNVGELHLKGGHREHIRRCLQQRAGMVTCVPAALLMHVLIMRFSLRFDLAVSWYTYSYSCDRRLATTKPLVRSI
jgi:hypothetical protein